MPHGGGHKAERASSEDGDALEGAHPLTAGPLSHTPIPTTAPALTVEEKGL